MTHPAGVDGERASPPGNYVRSASGWTSGPHAEATHPLLADERAGWPINAGQSILSPVDFSITDEPIRTSTQDQLGRSDFVRRVVQLLHGVRDAQASTVVGLVGPWGSGKTSIINLIREGLSGWEIRRLNPWSASDVDSLLGEFFVALVSGLKKPRSDAARQALLTCAEIAMPALGTVPVLGRGAEAVARKQVDRLATEGTWADRFDKATAQLRELEMPILIVIDDMDRLQPAELTSLLKAIRLLGRFPNVHYLLAYDERTITDLLCQSSVVGNDSTRAQAFLEKIVQLPLAIPGVPFVHLEELFNSELESILNDNQAVLTELDRRRFQAAYEALIRSTMIQLRLIRRYVAQVAAYLPLQNPSEVDVVDFLILTYIRQSFPRLFHELPRWKEDLVRGADNNGPGSAEIDWIERLELTGVPRDLLEAVHSVLILLFPKIDVHSLMAPLGRGPSNRQVNDRDYFDRYFAYSIPKYDVPDSLVIEALGQAVAEVEGEQLSRVREILAGSTSTSHGNRLVLLRKLDSLSRDVGSENIVRVIYLAIECFQATTDDGRLVGSEFHACRTWLSHLIVRAAQAERPPPADETLEALVRGTGIRVTAEILDEASEGPQREPWLSEIIGLAEQQALATIETRLEDMIEGDPPAVQALLRFIDNRGSGLKQLRARIRDGLETGRWPISVVAGEFVEVAYSGEGQRARILGVAEKELLRLLPYEIVRTYFDREEPMGSEVPLIPKIEMNDVSVENRRQVALRHLRKMRSMDEEFARGSEINDNTAGEV